MCPYPEYPKYHPKYPDWLEFKESKVLPEPESGKTWDLPDSDPIADLKAAFRSIARESDMLMTWHEVEMLLVGILRQLPDNKIQIHPVELDASGCTLFQERDTVTGVITLWFKKD